MLCRVTYYKYMYFAYMLYNQFCAGIANFNNAILVYADEHSMTIPR